MVVERLKPYFYLMRFHKPIGIFLLLWPTLWALWLASSGRPPAKVVIIFLLGVIVTRAAGCIINDIVDRRFDGQVERTCERPLVSGKVTVKEALFLLASLSAFAFYLLLQLNRLTIALAFIGAALTIIYPFMKRFTHWPQMILGFTFSWGVPMAFAALQGVMTWQAWFLFFAASFWPLMYDTLYAMTDRQDDMKIGIKSTAILFGDADRLIVGILQAVFLTALAGVGIVFQRSFLYYSGVGVAALFFIYQQQLIRNRNPAFCFRAFLNNNRVGFVIFLGILLS